ncbi:hypothetical protein SUGI_0787670 [Cryptomeria japonica]|uniref:uncharacterized protein LOC131856285 n=1 Tax=Cryptomeria japonica TaxID=3369 RepID=UPI002414B56B|nr:uncharacterized protein LOC131856285 [Cryptomeria japonica]GLJ38631.1 hypothetical protein SUGI_0787670 [Cryptomeria japonica]
MQSLSLAIVFYHLILQALNAQDVLPSKTLSNRERQINGNGKIFSVSGSGLEWAAIVFEVFRFKLKYVVLLRILQIMAAGSELAFQDAMSMHVDFVYLKYAYSQERMVQISV